MEYQKPEQKLISFIANSKEAEKVKSDIENGWNVISIVKNGDYFLGIIEKPITQPEQGTVFIPARKKIKIR